MSTRRYVIDNDDWYLEFLLRDDLTTVEVQDNHTGIVARAHALRFSQDKYDESIGMHVAYSRALQRLARKNEKHYIKQTVPVG